MVQRGAIMKLLSIIAAVMALVVASTTTMAEPKKPSLSNKATHRVKSPLPTGSQHTRTDSGNTTSLNAKVGTKKIKLNASIKDAMRKPEELPSGLRLLFLCTT